MTDLSREILRDWQVRKTAAQKKRFIDFLSSRIPGLRVEEGGLIRCRNLILGDPDTADLIFTAHYDTCARLPFPNLVTPKNLLLYLAYQLLIMVPFLLAAALGFLLMTHLGMSYMSAWFLSWLLFMGLVLYVFLFGPPNPHTVNDNTSGVLMLCELIEGLSDEEKRRCAFVFFDHEENGLIGSAVFARRHRKALKRRLVMNFDCISEGDHLLFVGSGGARRLCGDRLREAFVPEGGKTPHLESTLTAFYPSDQSNFPCGIGVAALKKVPLAGLYLGKIHTIRDTVLDEENYRWLFAGIRRFLVLYRPNV